MRVHWLIPLALIGVVGSAAAQNPSPEQLFSEHCTACHGDDATGTDRGPALARSRRLRTRSAAEIHDIIHHGTPGGMPPFDLPEPQLQALAGFIRSMNATAFDAQPAGDTAAGEGFFFGKGRCASCHTAMGRGKSSGPDLTSIGRQVTVADLERKLANPGAQVSDGYALVTVRLASGPTVRGFARKETLHGLQLQTTDGRLLLLGDGEYQIVSRDKGSAMPALNATPEEHRDLVAFLSRLGWLETRSARGPRRSHRCRRYRTDSPSQARRLAHL